MCGKFTQMATWRQVVDFSQPLTASPTDEIETVTPMRVATVIALDEDGARRAVRMRWGFPDPRNPMRPNPIHARAETIEAKPTFKDAFFARRGIIVVRTFNEGKEISPTKTEQYVVTPKDGRPLAIAIIWNRFEPPGLPPLVAFCMVTVPPNKLIGTITDRMPAVIQPADWKVWLGEERAPVDQVKAVLKPYEGDWDMAVQPKPPKKPRGA